MDRMQQLQERYERYVEEAKTVAEKAPAMAGFMGFGNDPKKDLCHARFYEDVGQWVKDFRASNPDAEEVYRAVRWIICAAADHRNQPSFGFLFAAQGHCKKLIGLLPGERCSELMQFYDKHYPRRERMPVQQEVYRLLCKGSLRKR